MKTITRPEMKEVLVTKFVADDGTEFATELHCKQYEARKAEQYFYENNLCFWEEGSGLPGYLGLGGAYTLFLIELTDKVLDICDEHIDGLERYAGQRAFLSCDGFEETSDWYFEGTLEHIAKELSNLVINLEHLKGE